MSLFGFSSDILFELLSVQSVLPGPNIDKTFNEPYAFSYTNDVNGLPYNNPFIPPLASNAQYTKEFPDWLSTTTYKVDVRGFYLVPCTDNANGYCLRFDWPRQSLDITSPITGQQVAYTTETIFYAQSSYFVAIVMCQWSNVFACKSRKVQIIRLRYRLLTLA